MRLPHPAASVLPAVLVVTLALTLTACQPPVTEVPLKKWNYIGIGKADAVLPEKARKGGFSIMDKEPITKEDLKPLEVKVVKKIDGKNYAFTSWGGYSWPNDADTTPYCYGVFYRRFIGSNETQALAQAQAEFMEYYHGKVTSSKPIQLEGKYPGRELKVTIPPREGLAERKAVIRLYYITEQPPGNKGKSYLKYYVIAVMALGDDAFLAAPNTAKVLNGFVWGK